MPVTAHKLLVLVAILIAVGFAALPSRGVADSTCDHFASPAGDDGNPGTAGSPVRSIARLIQITGAGEDGCLPAGSTFVEPLGTFIADDAGGQVGDPARIRTDEPGGEPAVVKGAAWLKGGVHDLIFERIRFTDSPGNGDKGTMLVIDGDRIEFRYTEITWRRGICISAGHREGYTAGDPANTVVSEGLAIEHSRIHDCGNDPAIVESLRDPEESGVHGIYLIASRGARIRDNYIYDNVSRGIQLWPDADGSTVEENVFDGNGSNINVGSSAAYGHFSEDNVFRDNIVSNAVLRSIYDEPWGPGDTESIVGNFPNDGKVRGNLFDGNCVYQANPNEAYGGYGYARVDDVFGDPEYLDAAAADFALSSGSPCTGKGPDSDDVPPPPVQPPPPTGPEQPGPGTSPDETGFVAGLRLAHCPPVTSATVFGVSSNAAVTATASIRWIGPGSARLLVHRRFSLHRGCNRLHISKPRAAYDASAFRIRVLAVGADGKRASIGGFRRPG